jgi:hypothetical protein
MAGDSEALDAYGQAAPECPELIDASLEDLESAFRRWLAA